MADAEEPSPTEIKIDTRLVTIVLSGPGATPDAAFELWERVRRSLSLTERHGLEAGGVGFTAELDLWRDV